MAIRPILVYPNDVLTSPTLPVTQVDESLRQLVQDMIETMHAEPGVGLAANQIGDSRRVAVVDLSAGEDPEKLKVFLNPRIVFEKGKQSGEEGCLSFPDISEIITRPSLVRLEALDLDLNAIEEEAEGFYARALCHEVDHLDGIVFLKRMSPLKRGLVQRRIQRMLRQEEWPEAVLPEGCEE